MTESEAIDVARHYACCRGLGYKVRPIPRAILLDPKSLEKAVPGLKIEQHPTWFIEFRTAPLDGQIAYFIIDDITRCVIRSNLPSVVSRLRLIPLYLIMMLLMPLVLLIEFLQDL